MANQHSDHNSERTASALEQKRFDISNRSEFNGTVEGQGGARVVDAGERSVKTGVLSV